MSQVNFQSNYLQIGTIQQFVEYSVDGNMKMSYKIKANEDVWLICEGQDLLIEDFPLLFDKIKYTYGIVVGVDKFKLPHTSMWGNSVEVQNYISPYIATSSTSPSVWQNNTITNGNTNYILYDNIPNLPYQRASAANYWNNSSWTYETNRSR